MSFLSPIAFLALAALIIPVLVHLRHNRKGRTLKIGSVALFTTNIKRNASSKKIRNWPLFLLRCLLIIVAVILLAQPVYTISKPGINKGWIVVTGTDIGTAYRTSRSQFDSLLAAGYTLHYAGQGFEAMQLSDSATHTLDKTYTAWQTIRELETLLPKGFPVFIFSNGLLRETSGARPLSSLAFSIKTVDLPEREIVTTLPSFITADDKQRTPTWHSKPEGNYFTIDDSVYPAAAKTGTQSVRVGIDDAGLSSNSYVKAALQAISGYTNRRISIESLSQNATYDVIIAGEGVIAIDSLPAKLNRGGKLLLTAAGPFGKTDESLIIADEVAIGRSAPVRLNALAKTTVPGKPLWQTSSGDGLLILEQRGDKEIYHLATSPDPSSTSIVWDERFVRELMKIILPDGTDTLSDQRKIDAGQLIPSPSAKQKTNSDEVIIEQHDLSPWCWGLMMIVFLAERIVVAVQSNRRNHA